MYTYLTKRKDGILQAPTYVEICKFKSELDLNT